MFLWQVKTNLCGLKCNRKKRRFWPSKLLFWDISSEMSLIGIIDAFPVCYSYSDTEYDIGFIIDHALHLLSQKSKLWRWLEILANMMEKLHFMKYFGLTFISLKTMFLWGFMCIFGNQTERLGDADHYIKFRKIIF